LFTRRVDLFLPDGTDLPLAEDVDPMFDFGRVFL
jgi:hypothetical protein